MNTNIEKAIKFFGTQDEMAKACGVSQAAVHKWAVGKSKPSALSAKKIERATSGCVAAAELCPEVFS